MVGKKHYLSKEKYDKLKEELSRLLTIDRRKNAEDLEYAKSLGDLSENAEYHEARDRQADTEDRIAELEAIFKNFELVENHSSDVAEVGTTIQAQREGGAEAETFILVGAEESDMLQGKISHESPLGSALLGHKKGDLVTVSTPRGDLVYKIIDIQ